jgi:hypothetical protein
MRIAGWEAALVATIEHHSEQPGAFGVSDCAILPADCILAVTGVDPFKKFRGYKTEAGGAKRMKRAGFADLPALFASVLPEIAPSLAQRGDVGFVLRDGVLSGGVFTSFGFARKAPHGVIYEPITAVVRAFKVD